MNSGEESALPMVSSSSSASIKYEGTASLECSLEDDFSGLGVVEVVRELRLITCERGEFGRGSGQGPGRGGSGKRRARDRRDTRKGTRRGTVRENNQTHDMDDHGDDMTRSCRHLSQCGVLHIMKHVRCAREKVTCEVCLSTPWIGNAGSRICERQKMDPKWV